MKGFSDTVINSAILDMEVIEHEQERKRAMLASRGMDIEMKEVEKSVRGLKRKIFILIQKPELPVKQHKENGRHTSEDMEVDISIVE